ncbi:ABC transporter permease [Mechercharimyces sp. CAU 1602]|uniref:ABC transporter permease n=1 Tax=Mechercharimyces sp. CAU 1602 TaxID=2973933 RepID=UPI0021633A3C|nr:ABC transporter permease [Mechercharimyces sp. CAU 1602]MCS1352090.1 ABC transporter permease [Mechercharimyces sp. CAU 1602]
MVYLELLKKNFVLQLQYRLAHFINNAGSIIFGFIYIAIWVAALEGKEETSPFTSVEITHYMAFIQCILWFTVFLSMGLLIPERVRTGAISLEMMRPTSYFLYVLSQESGRLFYNFCFRSIPIGLAFSFTVGFYLPHDKLTYVWTLFSLLLAVWLSLNLFYTVGITSCWTFEVSGAHLILFTLLFGLGGQMVPISLLPPPLAELALYLPFAGILYHPTMIFLEKADGDVLLLPLIWAILLPVFNLALTHLARRKLEVQGG